MTNNEKVHTDVAAGMFSSSVYTSDNNHNNIKRTNQYQETQSESGESQNQIDSLRGCGGIMQENNTNNDVSSSS